MSLLDDIQSARTTLDGRLTEALRHKKLRTRYTMDNVGAAGDDKGTGWRGKWASADKERLNQLDLLTAAINDPSWGADLNRQVEAVGQAGNADADAGFRQAEDQRRITAARSGMAASSNDAAAEGDNRARLATIKTQVAQQVSELKAAGIKNLEDMGRQLLSKALAGPEETQAMGIANAGSQDARRTGLLADQNNDQYRSLLSNTIAGFLNSTVTPGIQAGFQSADRWNQQQRDNYTDARDAGAYTGNFQTWADANGGTRSWWGF